MKFNNTYIKQNGQSKYIHLRNIQSTYGYGINSFLIRVNSGQFAQNYPLYIKIYDSKNNEINTKTYKVTISNHRLVSFFINNNISNGIGKIIIYGSLSNVPEE